MAEFRRQKFYSVRFYIGDKSTRFLFLILIDVECHGQKLNWIVCTQITRNVALIGIWLRMVQWKQIGAGILNNLDKCDNILFRLFLGDTILFLHGLDKSRNVMGFAVVHISAILYDRDILIRSGLLCKSTAHDICFAHSKSAIQMEEIDDLTLEHQIAKCRGQKIINRFWSGFSDNTIRQVIPVRGSCRPDCAVSDTE